MYELSSLTQGSCIALINGYENRAELESSLDGQGLAAQAYTEPYRALPNSKYPSVGCKGRLNNLIRHWWYGEEL